MQADKAVINSKEMVALFFVHEATRVFHDRLIEHSEKSHFYRFLSKELENYFQVNLYFPPYFKWCLGQKWFGKVRRHQCTIVWKHRNINERRVALLFT